MSEMASLRGAIRALVEARAPDRTACPSEVARRVADPPAQWRALMPAVRAAAFQAARDGDIVILQRGRVVEPERVRGPIRLGRPRHGD